MTKRMHNSEPQMDRLSSLPDALLTHILSLLSTKESFCTSVLSTRWKYLFSYVPTLKFFSKKHETHEIFVKFVNMVLSVHDVSCITSFNLYSHTPCHVSDVTSWISAAILRNAQILIVNTDVTQPTCLLPRDLFTCQMLVQLNLTGNFVYGVNDSVFLPSLKTFYIENCEFNDSHSVRKLFSSCPVLEVLTIYGCYSSDIKIFCISVPSLKILTIHCDSNECEWELNVPNLEYIWCAGDAPRWYSVNTLKSLHEAHISVEGYNGEEDYKILELVNKFDEVQFLSLSHDSAELLACNSFSTLMFNKLTTLELELQLNDCEGWHVIGKLLKGSPCLEVLVISDDEFFDCRQVVSEIDIVLPKRVPLCFSRSLKEVRLSTFCESKVEYEWLSYLLENAKVLEKLVLFVQSFAEQDEEYFAYLERLYMIRKKLLGLSRGSVTCEIVARDDF